jgi:hypothetical protein
VKAELVEASEALLRLNSDELRILNNALNGVCHGLDIGEFSTRMGSEPKEVRELLKQIRGLIDEMKSQRPRL